MKRLLLLLALCMVVVAPVFAISLDLQNPTEMAQVNTSTSVYPSGYYTSQYYVQNLSGGNSYYYVSVPASTQYGPFNTNPNPMTYSAVTSIGWQISAIALLDSTYGLIGTPVTCSVSSYSALPRREELVISGTTATRYLNGIPCGSAGGVTQNPTYVRWLVQQQISTFDDVIWGSTDDKTILGMPDTSGNGYYLKKDMINPSSSGFYNRTTGGLLSSTNFPATFSRSNLTGEALVNESIYLIKQDTGTVYGTYYTGTATAADLYINFAHDLVAASAPYGLYELKMGSTISDTIPYIANGATITFDRDTYSQGDTASITYLIDGAYWDTSTYTYSMKIYRGNDWSVADTQNIVVTSGTMTYTFTTSDTQGAYYAVIVATPNAGGNPIWMNYDYTNLNAYFTMYGYVNDAQNATVISGANVSIVQGSIVSNTVTTSSGNYTISGTGFLSGATISVNATATGHKQYYAQFTPITAGSKYINITLNATAPSYSGMAIGGIARDGIFAGTTITSGYGRPISGASVFVKNTSTGEYYTRTTNMAGWYLCDEGSTCGVLTSQRPYDMWGQKTGYANSQNYTAVTA